jgi:hypothetical protein
MSALHDFLSHIGIGEIFKDKTSWRIVEILIADDLFKSLDVGKHADLLIIA